VTFRKTSLTYKHAPHIMDTKHILLPSSLISSSLPLTISQVVGNVAAGAHRMSPACAQRPRLLARQGCSTLELALTCAGRLGLVGRARLRVVVGARQPVPSACDGRHCSPAREALPNPANTGAMLVCGRRRGRGAGTRPDQVCVPPWPAVECCWSQAGRGSPWRSAARAR
jgi:hypothetical protein